MATGQLYKRGKNWYLSISTGRKIDGKHERIRRRATGKTKAEAQAELDHELYKIRRASMVGGAFNNDYLLSEIIKDWCSHVDRTASTDQLASEYKGHANRIADLLNVEFVSELNKGLIESAMAQIAKTNSTNTANKSLAKLRLAIEYAKDNGLIISNPAKGIKMLRTIRKKYRRAVKPDEVEKLLETAPEPWRTYWHVLFSTGLRIEEFRSLTTGQIDLGRGKINIYETPFFKPKSEAAIRSIPIGDKVIKSIKSIELGPDLAFPSVRTGQKIWPSWYLKNYRRHIAAAMKELQRVPDLAELDLHGIRYTYATELFHAGADPKTVQYLCGHEDIQTTLEIYAQVKGHEATASAAKKLKWNE